ncbi:hypothetical protein B7H18_04390 [Pseudomonas putida]|nr:hypothetical protein B7H18_04390 [Pseudomonas putida]
MWITLPYKTFPPAFKPTSKAFNQSIFIKRRVLSKAAEMFRYHQYSFMSMALCQNPPYSARLCRFLALIDGCYDARHYFMV